MCIINNRERISTRNQEKITSLSYLKIKLCTHGWRDFPSLSVLYDTHQRGCKEIFSDIKNGDCQLIYFANRSKVLITLALSSF